ncbi:MAG: hypothetical protein GDA51_13365 [Ekhidna sp.]|nr:hypothetical protein [Ekhidna sp.]
MASQWAIKNQGYLDGTVNKIENTWEMAIEYCDNVKGKYFDELKICRG